jgi:hypothetical protein
MSTPRQPTAVEASKHAITTLRAAISAVEDKALFAAAERDAIAYDAHISRHPRALAKLESLGLQLGALGREQESLQAALRTAEQKSLEAKSEETKTGEAKRAREAIDIDKKATKLAAQLDAALADFLKLYSEYAALMARGAVLGSAPGQHPITLNARRCLASVLHDSPLKVDPISPSLRRTFTEMHSSYAERARGWALQRMPHDTKTEEAA